MGYMNVLDKTGHTSHRWDPNNKDEVAAARATFDALTAKHYSAFRNDKTPSERMKSFDPNAGDITFAPQFAGG